MKYSNKPFVISEQYRLSVLDKVDAWRRTFGNKKAIHVTFVTAEGLKPNNNSDIVQSEVRLANLFA